MSAKQNRVLQGFTLIELMIVVAILGILSAMATSQYRAYVARSQITRAVGEAGAMKTGVETCLLAGKTGFSGDSACDLQATGSSLFTGEAQSAGVDLGDGVGVPQVDFSDLENVTIVGTLGNKAATMITGAQITWRRNGDGSWSCTSTADTAYNTVACPRE